MAKPKTTKFNILWCIKYARLWNHSWVTSANRWRKLYKHIKH